MCFTIDFTQIENRPYFIVLQKSKDFHRQHNLQLAHDFKTLSTLKR